MGITFSTTLYGRFYKALPGAPCTTGGVAGARRAENARRRSTGVMYTSTGAVARRKKKNDI